MAKINWKLNKISSSNYKKLLLLKVDRKLSGKHKIIFKKSDNIIKDFNNLNLLIYKGCFYRKLMVTKFINNYKFGEFAFTRKPFRYMLKAKQ